jgi:hypothetical protein
MLEGEVRDYRKTISEPSVEIAAVQRPDSADWFDLRVKVSIDGEVVPFGDLFVALTEGQDFLILDTGVYFSLDRPEFAQLRELIEESRAPYAGSVTFPRSMRSRFRRRCRSRSGPISSMATAGCAFCGAINWAASWPTIWVSAKLCRHLR